MKKNLLLIAVLAILGASAAYAQPRAVGVRLGWNWDAVYQHTVGNGYFEVNAGVLDLANGAHATALYDWIWLTPNWTPKGEWNWFSGVGANVGYHWNNAYVTSEDATVKHASFMAGVVGNIGLEYNFWFPLSLAIDYRPTIGAYFGENAGFYKGGLFDGALSVRYKF